MKMIEKYDRLLLTIKKQASILSLMTLLLSLNTTHIKAQILAYDGFTTVSGGLLGNANVPTSFGWLNPWDVQDNTNAGYNITNTTPMIINTLQSSEYYAVGGGGYQGAGRLLDNSFAGNFADYFDPADEFNGNRLIGNNPTYQTIYMSAVVRIDADNGDEKHFYLTDTNIDWCDGCATSANITGFGYFGSGNSDDAGVKKWTMRVGTNYIKTTKTVTPGEVVFVIMKIQFGTTATVSLFLNPSISTFAGTEPSTPDATYNTSNNVPFRTFNVYGQANNAWSLDEIRFGKTYADVTPSFVPTALTSLSISGGSMSISTAGGFLPLTATYFPSTATSPVAISWQSSDVTKAMVGSNGVVTATGAGYVTITGIAANQANSVSGIYTILVSNQPKVSYVADDFEATPGNWDQLSTTGYGWAGNWTKDGGDDTKFQIKNDNPLTYPGLLSTPAYAIGGSPYQSIGRFIDKSTTGRLGEYVYTETPSDQYGSSTDYIGKPGTTLYISFMTRIEDVGNDIEFGLTRSGSPYGIPDYFVGIGEVGLRVATESGNWVLKSQYETFQTGQAVVKGQVQLIVLKIQFNVNNAPAGYNLTTASNIVSVYLNPTSIGSDEPAATYTNTITGRFSFQALAFDNFGDGDHASVDEIRLGGSYAQVTPVKDITNITFNGLSINTYHGSSPLEIGLLPADIPQEFYYTILPTDAASITGNTITAFKNGIITVTGAAAVDPSKSAIALVTITGQAPDMITINTTVLSTSGSTIGLSANVTPAEADQSLVWSSSDLAVGTINSVTGLFTPLANGQTVITAASGVDNSIQSMVTLTVIFPVVNIDATQIALSKSGDILTYAGSSTITSMITPANATNSLVTLSLMAPVLQGITLNTATGVVSTNGAANGTVTVMGVSVSNPTVSGMVIVAISGQNAESITINPTETTLTGSSTFATTILPANANSEITWSVSDTSIATINAAGELTPKSFGEVVTVTATLVKGGLTASSIVYLMANTTIISGISSDLFQNVIIYPNPAKDKVSLGLPKGVTSILIYNVEGIEVYSTKVNSDGSAIEVPLALSKGFYLVKINAGNVNVIRKLSVE